MKESCQSKLRVSVFLVLGVIAVTGFGFAAKGFSQGKNKYSAEVVWSEFDGRNYQIFQSSFRDGEWSAKTQLSNNDATNTIPVIDSGDDGTLWVVWSAARGTVSDLYYSYFNANGWSSPSKIPSQFSSNTSPSIIIEENNIPWIVWSGFDGQDDDVYMMRWNGNSWGSPARINRNDGTPDIMPTIWRDSYNSIHVNWSGYNGKVYANYISTYSKAKWSDEVEDHENEYQDLMKKIADDVPALPDFIKTPELAAMCINSNGQRIAFRVRDMKQVQQTQSVQSSQSAQNDPTATEEIIIGLGDSITEGVPYHNSPGNGQQVGGYEPHLEALQRNVGWQTKVLNYGVGGESSRMGLHRIDGILTLHAPKYILILEGTNDLIYYGISVPSTIYNLSLMVDISRYRNTIPILSTLTPDTNLPQKNIPIWYNPEIINVAIQKKVPLADQYAALAPAWGGLTYDGIHPNDAGYQVMAAKWFDAIPRITLSTKEATDVGEDTAKLNGVINPYGYPTTYYFEYGYTTDFGGKTAVTSAGSGNGEVAVSAGLAGISENHVYFFRLVASNDYLTEKGSILQFKTAEAPSKSCFIATAAFGSSLEPHVVALKTFRDTYLSATDPGRRFIQFYYRHSPPIAKYISEHETAKTMVRIALYPVAWFCELAFLTSVWIKTLFAGIFIFLISGAGILFLKRR